MLGDYISPVELQFLFALLLSIVCGFGLGAERELRLKDAGISTHILVVAGAMLFTFLSGIVDPLSTSRIAAQVVAGIGFLGAGLILKEGGNVRNLTTAASMWYAAAVGMALGYGYFLIAIVATVAGIFVPRIPSVRKHPWEEGKEF